MDLDEYLSRSGADLPALLSRVATVSSDKSRDIVLAVGSLVEALGNNKSDVDLLLIVPEDSDTVVHEKSVGWLVGRCVVDMRVIRLSEVHQLLARLSSWAQGVWEVSEAADFTHEERLLLHRLLNGRLLSGNEVATSFRPSRKQLARLKLHVARHMSRTIQVDMVGYRDDGDYRSLAFAAQELLGHAIDGLLAGYLFTSPTPKWRSRLLALLPMDWEDALAIRPTGLTAVERMWDLYRVPVAPEPGPSLAHGLRVLTFARAVFAWAERKSLENPDGKQVAYRWSSEGSSRSEDSLPRLELDVDFALSGDGAVVGRLNEFCESLRISEHEFALLLSFDGITSAREAESAVPGLRAGDAGRLAARAAEAGLCIQVADKQARTTSEQGGCRDDFDLGTLADELSVAGYGEFLACFDPLAPRPSRWREQRECAPDELKPVVDLFLLNRSVHCKSLPEGIRRLVPGLISAGLIQDNPDGRLETPGLVVLRNFGNWLICQPPQANPLLYFGDDSVALAARLSPRSGGNSLDLCAGAGIHALHSVRFAKHVTAVEKDPLAVELAILNSRLNRVADRIEVRQGDLYEPVDGRRFDSICANPPMLPYPEHLRSPAIGSGGSDGLRLTWRILDGLPRALNDNGCAQIVGTAFSDGILPLPGDRLEAVARDKNLVIRLSTLSHTSLDPSDEFFEHLIGAAALISGEAREVVRESYSQMISCAGASHICTFFLHAVPGVGRLELVDVSRSKVARSSNGGRWYV